MNTEDDNLTKNTKILFLVGFMGSGKSWTSRKLSEEARIPRYDLDEEIERELQMDIASFFRLQGEQAFRRVERESLERLCERILKKSHAGGSLNNARSAGFEAVVATGGGTPCFGDNMDWMNSKGFTLWLNPPRHVLMDRLRKARAKRPLLSGVDDEELEEAVDGLMEKRRPFYRKAALEWKGDGKPPEIEWKQILEHA